MSERSYKKLRAPIVVCDNDDAAVAAMADYFATLRQDGNLPRARQESQRLAPYFTAMENYLRDECPNQATPRARKLSQVFNGIAAFTRNTLLSDVVIVPDSAVGYGPLADLFSASGYRHSSFSTEYVVPNDLEKYFCDSFSFGFMQVFQKEPDQPKDAAASSTTISVLFLDTGILREVQQYKPEKMLRALQSVMTFVNHDALHHLTVSVLPEAIAHKFVEQDMNPLIRWGMDRVTVFDYEDWAQISHEKILLHPANKAQVDGLGQHINAFFDELGNISKAMAPKGCHDNRRIEAHRAVNYFSMVMAHALTRVFPLNHPLFNDVFARMKSVDPAVLQTGARQERLKASVGAPLHKLFRKSIVASYRKAGCDFGSTYKKPSYANFKRLQLVELAGNDTEPHAPETPKYQVLRSTNADSLVTLIDAVDKTVRASAQPSALTP